jgi:hypothetical protein
MDGGARLLCSRARQKGGTVAAVKVGAQPRRKRLCVTANSFHVWTAGERIKLSKSGIWLGPTGQLKLLKRMRCVERDRSNSTREDFSCSGFPRGFELLAG